MEVIKALLARLKDKKRSFRLAVFLALAQLAKKDDATVIAADQHQRVTAAAFALLEDRDQHFRTAARQALAQLAEKGLLVELDRHYEVDFSSRDFVVLVS